MNRLWTSCLGLGWLPVAPGTWGSLPPVFILGLLGYLMLPAWAAFMALSVTAVLASVICVSFASGAISATGKDDPGEVVADELAGQSLCLTAIPLLGMSTMTSQQIWVAVFAGFLLFRLFDVFKPWPVHRLERLPRGWGILADDLMAGLYAGLLLGFFLWVAQLLQAGPLPGFSGTLNWGSALVLGAFQGVTEFLPVSSSGHLVLLETLMGFTPAETQMLLFDLAAHVGTVLAIVIVLRKSCGVFCRQVLAGIKQIRSPKQVYQRNASVRLLVLTIIGTAVTGVPAMLIKDTLTDARGNLLILSGMWILTGTFLFLTDKRKKTRLGLRQFGIVGAVIVGLAQLVAIMPGVSRSGATICAAVLFCGLHRRWAIEYSMLLAVFAILAASGVEFMSNLDEIRSGDIVLLPILAGAVTSLLIGIPALKWLIAAARKARFQPFALYCFCLAVFAFVMGMY